MESKLEQNKKGTSLITIDPRLNKYEDVILFPEKVAKAKEMLRTVGLPKELAAKK